MERMTKHFDPRAPRGARPGPEYPRQQLWYISIHAPREGRDLPLSKLAALLDISIHAPREGRDAGGSPRGGVKHDFDPRAPRGARRAAP